MSRRAVSAARGGACDTLRREAPEVSSGPRVQVCPSITHDRGEPKFVARPREQSPMFLRLTAATALVTTVATLGCYSEVVAPDAELSVIGADRVSASHVRGRHAAESSMSAVVTFADPMGEAVGESKLVRNANGVSVRLSTGDLEPRSIATLWIVVFNEPGECSPPACGEEDLFEEGPVPDVMYMAGSVVDRNGTATFAGHRAEGDHSKSLWASLGMPSPGLIDASTAEIHFVVRAHGPRIPGMIGAMLHTFNGGCVLGDFPAGDPVVGPPGPNTCEDVQFAVHMP